MAGGIGILEPPESLMQVFARIPDDNQATNLLDLPLVLLNSILARISDPVAATHVICTCRLLRAISKSVPYRLRVSCTKLDDGVGISSSEEEIYKKHSLTAAGSWTRKVLSTIRGQMPSTKFLDLSGCWIVDEDVAAVLADLRCLEGLILDGCQKLTSTVADALAVSVRSGPQALSLQRCFGLGPAAAGNLLAAAAADGSQLQCVLLSHLDRLDLPREPPLLDVQKFGIYQTVDEVTGVAKAVNVLNAGPTRSILAVDDYGTLGSLRIGSGIRILALHNCGSLGALELAAVGITCPMLEFLLLGGSIEGLCLNRPESLPLETVTGAVSAIVTAIESLSFLQVLEVTFFPGAVVRALRERIRKGVKVWDFCEKRSIFSALSLINSCTDLLLELSANGRPNVPIADAVSRPDHSKNSLGIHSRAEENAKFLDGFETRSRFDGIDKKKGWAEKVFLALRAAVNCSDLRRRTPLHAAASVGDVEIVRGLLSMGAASGLRDSAGATALFAAAWFGYADICSLLLRNGADVLSRNRSGENPLYIAALRGHSLAVEAMLSYCKANNINWQSVEVYGDGWTPLMAAAVADRQDVAKVLLRAAGSDVCVDWTKEDYGMCKNICGGQERDSSSMFDSAYTRGLVSEHQACLKNMITLDIKKDLSCSVESFKNPLVRTPPQILDAQNRYGQTALHIAARRASVWFVIHLLQAGASVDIRDEYNKKPVDIAHNQKHTVVMNMLKQWEFQLKKKTPSSALPVSNDSAGNPVSASSFILHQSKPGRKCDGTGLIQVDSTERNPGKDSRKAGSSKRVWREKIRRGPEDIT